MQFKALTLSALVAAASAQSSTTVTTSASGSAATSVSVAPSSSLNSLSVLAILATAVPTSLAGLYLTNSRSAEQLVASELSAGSTPAWFASLPTPVQTYLLGSGGSNITGVSSSTMGVNGTMANSTTVIGGHTTTNSRGQTVTRGGITRTTHASGRPTRTATQGGSGSGSSSSSTGGASLPTAIVGAGLAGAVGLVGLFAL